MTNESELMNMCVRPSFSRAEIASILALGPKQISELVPKNRRIDGYHKKTYATLAWMHYHNLVKQIGLNSLDGPSGYFCLTELGRWLFFGDDFDYRATEHSFLYENTKKIYLLRDHEIESVLQSLQPEELTSFFEPQSNTIINPKPQ